MIELVKNINIVGPIEDIDKIVERYISRYDIQLEYPSKDLAVRGAVSVNAQNPYADIVLKAEKLTTIAGLIDHKDEKMSGENAVKIIAAAYETFGNRDEGRKKLEDKKDAIMAYMDMLEPFATLPFLIERLDDFKRISYRFGRMPVSNYKQFETFLFNDAEVLFVQGKSDKEYIWGAYFVPEGSRDKVDSIFSSMHFDRIDFVNAFEGKKMKGTPAEVLEEMKSRLSKISQGIDRLTADTMNAININNNELTAACTVVKSLYDVYDIKKYAAVTKRNFFIFEGWMTERDASRLEKEIEKDDKVIFVVVGDDVIASASPPTKLKNPPVIRFFEFFVRMYGMPSYHEFDPTPFIAITYTLLFGIMFGDLGQGAVLALLGFVLYKVKHMALGAIMTVIGISSMVFGVLYGSVFGFEEWIPALWRRPAEDINSTLFMAIGLGIVMIVISMLINVVVTYRSKQWGKLFFGPSGLAGLVFYSSVIGMVVSIVYGQYYFGAILVFLLIVVPLILIAFREPLTKLLEGRKKLVEGGIALFLLETFIELFEVLLTYFTNTVSFVRVGAFALSHAGMMSVVIMLSQTANGSHNLIVIILGNILVLALEGLVVGIQVLRLEFYEMFSRFFEGGGREFKSYRKTK